MKSYILDIPNKLSRKIDALDIKSILCNKEWRVFNDSYEMETYMFNEDNTLYITKGGVGSKADWRYIPSNKSLAIEKRGSVLMFHLSFSDDKLAALQLGDSNQYVILLNTNKILSSGIENLSDIQKHILDVGEEKETVSTPSTTSESNIPIVDRTSIWDNNIVQWAIAIIFFLILFLLGELAG